MSELIGKFQLQGWEYQVLREASSLAFEIVPNIPDYEAPDRLSKIYRLNDYALDAVENGYIYAPHPHYQFNDAYDCHSDLVIADDPDFTQYVMRSYFPKTSLEHAELDELAKIGFEDLFYQLVAPISMTRNPNNSLMWGYYNNHQGFAVEMDINHLQQKVHGPFPIHYQKEPQPISLKDFGWPVAMFYHSYVKSDQWAHEEEYRLLLESPRLLKSLDGHPMAGYDAVERKLHYDPEALTAIALGNRFFSRWEMQEIDKSTLSISMNKGDSTALRMRLISFTIKREINTYFAHTQKDFRSLHFSHGRFEVVDEDDKVVHLHYKRIE